MNRKQALEKIYIIRFENNKFKQGDLKIICSDRKPGVWVEYVIVPTPSTAKLGLSSSGKIRALHLHEPLLGDGARSSGQGEQHQGRR